MTAPPWPNGSILPLLRTDFTDHEAWHVLLDEVADACPSVIGGPALASRECADFLDGSGLDQHGVHRIPDRQREALAALQRCDRPKAAPQG